MTIFHYASKSHVINHVYKHIRTQQHHDSVCVNEFNVKLKCFNVLNVELSDFYLLYHVNVIVASCVCYVLYVYVLLLLVKCYRFIMA